MYILDVIPTVKIPKGTPQILSYFSKESVSLGSLVSVPLGRANISAFVVESYSVDEEKMNIKKSGFKMRNINGIISNASLLSEIENNLLKWFLRYYSSPLGLTVKTFIPQYFLNKKKNIDIEKIDTIKKDAKKEVALLFKEERADEYKKAINEALKKNKQVLFLVPDLFSLKFWEDELKEFSPILASSKLTPKKHFEIWKSIRNGKIKFLISTRMGIFFDFYDLDLVVLEEEDDQAYKSRDMMPYYHTKGVALKLAELHGAKAILGSQNPDIETYYNYSDDKPSKNIERPANIIDMRNEMHGGNYSILSYNLQNNLENILNKKKQAILFISRKGSETFVFCRDCGYVETCPDCESSLIHHKYKKSMLICHSCGFYKEASIKCPKCESPRIKYFGAGTEKAKEEVLKLFPDAKVEILDSDIAKDTKDQEKIFEKFKNKEVDILIGTQLLFKKYNMPKADLLAVLSMDNLLYQPDFRSGERIFKIARSMSSLGNKNSIFIIQTYTPENPTIEIASKLDYKKFYESEIAQRKVFSYPPFSHLIKLSYKSKYRQKADNESLKLAQKLKGLKLESVQILGPAPAYIPKIKQNYIFNIIIKIKDSKDFKKEKMMLLDKVEEGWTIDVDPENLL